MTFGAIYNDHMAQSSMRRVAQTIHTMGDMTTLIDQVLRIKNISEFAVKSGVPRRTLVRIRTAGRDYPIRPTTRLAIEAALKKYKPAMEDVIVGEKDAAAS
jgi:predicted transcriptional regulator